ncbi:class I glutamine amidotransferase-like protein [Chaetomidium leptoderma]|uniref:Class I glutamine amidotransferase-like protein n=1 Tax=Chaetomidium leptoderma TaxID=669021 RepID=A0AAN6VVW0_9PEZI|nr:class I glutamine amidotransferase-like protein [Chaetomidium leptoderma]
MVPKGFFPRACTLLPLLMATIGAQGTKTNAPTSIGIVVFPGYEPLDIWGPLELFSSISRTKDIELSIIGHEIGLVTTKPPPRAVDPVTGLPPPTGARVATQILATHSFANAPPLDILLIPGGLGNRVLEERNDTGVEDFIAARYPQLKYLLSVCTGAVSIANSGVLKGKKATSNKASWKWVVTHGKNVTWVPSARWVVDGNIWTSSGVAAGMDMVYAFLSHYYSNDMAAVNEMINLIEYAPHEDPHWDPFAIVHKVPGADPNGSLVDCVKPGGY